MPTVKDAIARIESHEKECALRYSSIEQRLESGSKRFDKLEIMLWSMYPFIITVTAAFKWIGSMEIIVFALMVQLTPDQDERVASYWVNQKQCVHVARVLSSREENYKSVLAYCKPAFVDPMKTEIQGYAKKTTTNQ